MLEFFSQPWHWSVGGIGIGLMVAMLLVLGNKKFGISSSLRHTCAICAPGNIPFFQYNWKKEIWNMFFVVGVFMGGFFATQFLSNPDVIVVAEATQHSLSELGITDFSGLMPNDIFHVDQLFTLKGFIFFVVGGFLVGFGTRYAGGCTSGHAIMGLSNLQWPSLVATISFMVGGFFSTHLILPLIFKWI